MKEYYKEKWETAADELAKAQVKYEMGKHRHCDCTDYKEISESIKTESEYRHAKYKYDKASAEYFNH